MDIHTWMKPPFPPGKSKIVYAGSFSVPGWCSRVTFFKWVMIFENCWDMKKAAVGERLRSCSHRKKANTQTHTVSCCNSLGVFVKPRLPSFPFLCQVQTKQKQYELVNHALAAAGNALWMWLASLFNRRYIFLLVLNISAVNVVSLIHKLSPVNL